LREVAVMDSKFYTAKEVAELLHTKDGLVVVDVRTVEEYQAAHIEGSRCIPLSQLSFRYTELSPDSHILLVCKSGKRSQQAFEQLSKLGYSHMSILQGGIEEWDKAGLPLIRGKAKISLERQVRIIAGSFILLGLLFSPLWWLPWFVGGMLIFAGITNSCLMMRLLMLLPYNKNIALEERTAGGSCCS